MSEAVITEEYIDRELREMHKKMIGLFHVDFPYFKNVIILDESEAENLLTENILQKLEEKGVSYNLSQRAQIRGYLSGNEGGSLFENVAFYEEKRETLYLSRNLLLNHPDMIIPVCVHELAEKLVSTLTLSPSIKKSAENLLEKYINSKDPKKRISLQEFLSRYKEVVFESVFKEGCCEAISLRTLMHSDLKDRVEFLEKELILGHSKWIGILFDLEIMNLGDENQNGSMFIKKDEIEKLEDAGRILTRILNSSQAIKGISYHLGYPIAKEIIDTYGISGIKAALKNPPLKAEYFVEPSKYISSLEIKRDERR